MLSNIAARILKVTRKRVGMYISEMGGGKIKPNYRPGKIWLQNVLRCCIFSKTIKAQEYNAI